MRHHVEIDSDYHCDACGEPCVVDEQCSVPGWTVWEPCECGERSLSCMCSDHEATVRKRATTEV